MTLGKTSGSDVTFRGGGSYLVLNSNSILDPGLVGDFPLG